MGIREVDKYEVNFLTGKKTEVVGYRGVETSESMAKASAATSSVSTGSYGVHIRLGTAHSVILTGTTSDGFTVYQANADNKNCKVTSGTYKYSKVVSNYSSITANE